MNKFVGGVVSAIQNKDVLTGVREAISSLTQNSSNDGKLLVSQLTGILDGEAGAKDEYSNSR
ncbi:MAG: hypothetical protein PHR66_06910 [Desulfuromonadaceae bacterium]|nr:hypothetical protein [Desulfuromonadaceae bacterium]MDD2581705.1 hypothetical protein [Desulfuromonadaceae bacterium]